MEINALKDEIRNMKIEFQKSERSMNETTHNLKIQNDKFKKELDELREEKIALDEDIVACRNETRNLQNKINAMEKSEKKFDHETVTTNGRVDKLEKELEKYIEDNKKLIEKLNGLINQSGQNKALTQSIIDINCDQNVKITELREKELEMSLRLNQISEAQNQNNQVMLANHNGYTWKIDKFLEKKDTAKKGENEEMNSDSFFSHSNGYKMCLKVYPNGSGDGKDNSLSIYFVIMRGPYDELLSWPMKLGVTIALMNQDTNIAHSSQTYKYNTTGENLKYVFDKPKTDVNPGYGTPKFYDLVKLVKEASVLKNNEIVIKCTVKLND